MRVVVSFSGTFVHSVLYIYTGHNNRSLIFKAVRFFFLQNSLCYRQYIHFSSVRLLMGLRTCNCNCEFRNRFDQVTIFNLFGGGGEGHIRR